MTGTKGIKKIRIDKLSAFKKNVSINLSNFADSFVHLSCVCVCVRMSGRVCSSFEKLKTTSLSRSRSLSIISLPISFINSIQTFLLSYQPRHSPTILSHSILPFVLCSNTKIMIFLWKFHVLFFCLWLFEDQIGRKEVNLTFWNNFICTILFIEGI